ncbi:MAG: PadR family transcriptional regulator [Paludibacteraceae bacterium]|nr:PadR family transcriptional regulator [Bacteroidales bacterium]MDY4149220.1 PadR family transcriptional regulator [Paludibacteraceae bacterium]
MVENIKSQMRKGILEYCILTIISRREAYASDILEVLKAADLIVVEGTLYPLLTRMKNNGLLAYRWQESTDGPPRKYYQLTDEGRILLEDLKREWDAICLSINTIVDQHIVQS